MSRRPEANLNLKSSLFQNDVRKKGSYEPLVGGRERKMAQNTQNSPELELNEILRLRNREMTRIKSQNMILIRILKISKRILTALRAKP